MNYLDTKLNNPILPGFNPDPCILHSGDFYYIATSTFEWWPGVRIYRSPNLSDWELMGHALNRSSQLNMRGNPDSGGVWAPAISERRGMFYLVYSDVKNFKGIHKDLGNFLVTAPTINGPWSDPVFLNRSGFDPSFFHDEDGRSWLLNQLWDPRPKVNNFAGILLQEIDLASGQLLGEPQNIFAGSELGFTEGPHLYKHRGWYFLVTAEGGTGRGHAVTVARSRSINGPYEVSPNGPLVTSREDLNFPMQNNGHGSWVEAPDGRWFMAHLCSRPRGAKSRSILGRETALQEFEWSEDDWPVLIGDSNRPALHVDLKPADKSAESWSTDFGTDSLPPQWNTLREPADPTWLTMEPRVPGIVLGGRLSLSSTFDQSLIATRLCHHCCELETWLDFEPSTPLQKAGLALYYNTLCYHSLYVSASPAGTKLVEILTSDAGKFSLNFRANISSHASAKIGLRAKLTDGTVRFYYSTDSKNWDAMGEPLDASILSDEYIYESGLGFGFTGSFAALSCQDSSGQMARAKFTKFSYRAGD